MRDGRHVAASPKNRSSLSAHLGAQGPSLGGIPGRRGENVKSILSLKLRAWQCACTRLPLDELDRSSLLVRTNLGHPNLLHELAVVLVGLGTERRERLAVIAEHGRRRAERGLPAANQLAHRRPCRSPIACLLHARHGVRLTLQPTLFRTPSGIAGRLRLSFHSLRHHAI